MIRTCALIAVLIAGALFDFARGSDLVECEPQRVTGDGRYWAYRIVDGRECWYPGRPGKPKNELFWGRGASPSARQTVDQLEAETEPSEPPSQLAAGHRLVEYSVDERVVRQVFVVLSHNGFCFPQRGKPPLNLQMFISCNAFYNSTFFYEQLEFSWLIVAFVVGCRLGCEIDAPGSDPIAFYDTLVGYICLTPESWKGSWKSSWKKVVNQERCGE